MIVDNKKYYTNITDQKELDKCIEFYNKGCLSYAISFDNKETDIIQTTNLKSMKVNYLRSMNFDKCFLPISAANLKDSKSVLQKGYDLIEIL